MIDHTTLTTATLRPLVAALCCLTLLCSCSTSPTTSTWSTGFPDTTRLEPRSAVYTTSDAGRTWERAAIGTTDVLYDIAPTIRGAWIAVGADGVIMRSGDGLRNWTAIASGTSAHLRGLSNNPSSGQMIAVGAAGTILRSSDGDGATWSAIASGATESLYGITATSYVAIAVGESGTILRSTDGGTSWRRLGSPTTAALSDVTRGSLGAYYAVGSNGTALQSSDEGATWRTMSIPGLDARDWLTAVLSPAPLQVHIAGYRNDAAHPRPQGRIFSTLDGGATWSMDTLSLGGAPLDAIYGLSAYGRMLFAVGARNASYRSTDDGAGWSSGSAGDSSHRMTRVRMFGESAAVATGD